MGIRNATVKWAWSNGTSTPMGIVSEICLQQLWFHPCIFGQSLALPSSLSSHDSLHSSLASFRFSASLSIALPDVSVYALPVI